MTTYKTITKAVDDLLNTADELEIAYNSSNEYLTRTECSAILEAISKVSLIVAGSLTFGRHQ